VDRLCVYLCVHEICREGDTWERAQILLRNEWRTQFSLNNTLLPYNLNLEISLKKMAASYVSFTTKKTKFWTLVKIENLFSLNYLSNHFRPFKFMWPINSKSLQYTSVFLNFGNYMNMFVMDFLFLHWNVRCSREVEFYFCHLVVENGISIHWISHFSTSYSISSFSWRLPSTTRNHANVLW
jgi:hypothetical protein